MHHGQPMNFSAHPRKHDKQNVDIYCATVLNTFEGKCVRAYRCALYLHVVESSYHDFQFQELTNCIRGFNIVQWTYRELAILASRTMSCSASCFYSLRRSGSSSRLPEVANERPTKCSSVIVGWTPCRWRCRSWSASSPPSRSSGSRPRSTCSTRCTAGPWSLRSSETHSSVCSSFRSIFVFEWPESILLVHQSPNFNV